MILFVILASSTWVYFDAKKLGVRRGADTGLWNFGPGGWLAGCLLLWLVVFPAYLLKRRKFKFLAGESTGSVAVVSDARQPQNLDDKKGAYVSFNFKTASKIELQQEFNRIAAEIGDEQFFTKKELHYLPEVLAENEQVLAFTSGLMDGNTWLITLTDRRIIFLDKGLIYGLSQAVIDLDKVNSISFETGMMFASIAVTDGAVQRQIKNVWKKTAKEFTNRVQKAIEARKALQNRPQVVGSISAVEQLEKLAALKEKGLISSEEFDASKKKILAA